MIGFALAAITQRLDLFALSVAFVYALQIFTLVISFSVFERQGSEVNVRVRSTKIDELRLQAQNADVRRETIVHVENNKYNLSLTLACKLSRVLGSTIEDVFCLIEKIGKVMFMRKMRFGILFLIVFILGSITPSTQASAGVMGLEFTEMFLAGETSELWELFDKPLQDVFGNVGQFNRFQEQTVTAIGSESDIIRKTTTPVDHWLVYEGVRFFPQIESSIVFQWAYTEKGVIGGLHIYELPTEAPSEFLDYQTKTDLRLPFTEEMFVFWGGRTIEDNYHAVDASQRFAYDFVIVKDGTTDNSGGALNGDYNAFGTPIIAPGAGVIAVAQDGVPDNPVGVMNTEQPLGNHVIIDHQNGEFSFLAHLKQGSVSVQEGMRVEQGDLLGLCGNSGNSSEPHLHYHLQDSPTFLQANGLPAQFQDYILDSKVVERGEPIRGDVVRNEGE